MWMFIGTVVGLPIAAILLTWMLPVVSEKSLRLGLWMNGVTGRYQDEIVHHHRTGKLPGEPYAGLAAYERRLLNEWEREKGLKETQFKTPPTR